MKSHFKGMETVGAEAKVAGIQNKYSFSITDRPEKPNPHLCTPTLLVSGVSCKKILSRFSKNVSVKLDPPTATSRTCQ